MFLHLIIIIQTYALHKISDLFLIHKKYKKNSMNSKNLYRIENPQDIAVKIANFYLELAKMYKYDQSKNQYTDTILATIVDKAGLINYEGILNQQIKLSIRQFISHYSQLNSMQIQYNSMTKHQVKIQDDQQEYIHHFQVPQLISIQSTGQGQQEFFSLQQSQINQNNRQQHSHQIFMKLLIESLKQMKLLKNMQKINVQLKLLTNGRKFKGPVIFFLFKLIVIKIWNPNSFPSIIKKMISLIQQFVRKEAKSKVQIYAKQVLSNRYLNCIRLYTITDDIWAVANQLYINQRTLFNQKMHILEEYKRLIQKKASEYKLENQKINQKIIRLKVSQYYDFRQQKPENVKPNEINAQKF